MPTAPIIRSVHEGTSEEAERSAAHECEFELLLWEEEMARLERRTRQWDDLLVPRQPDGHPRWRLRLRRPARD